MAYRLFAIGWSILTMKVSRAICFFAKNIILYHRLSTIQSSQFNSRSRHRLQRRRYGASGWSTLADPLDHLELRCVSKLTRRWTALDLSLSENCVVVWLSSSLLLILPLLFERWLVNSIDLISLCCACIRTCACEVPIASIIIIISFLAFIRCSTIFCEIVGSIVWNFSSSLWGDPKTNSKSVS